MPPHVHNDHSSSERSHAPASSRLGRLPEHSYAAIWEHAPVGVFWCSPRGELQDANPYMVELAGDSAVESLLARARNVGEDLFGGVQGQDANVESAMEPDGSSSAVWEFETPMRRADGGQVWISVRMRAIRDASHKVSGYVGFCRELTASRRMAAALQETMRRNDIFTELINALQTAATREQCCDLTCDAAMRATGSARGAVAWLEWPSQALLAKADAPHAEAEAPRLHAPTLANYPWRGALGAASGDGAKRLEPLWREAVASMRPVVSNAPEADPRLGEEAASLAGRVLAVPAVNEDAVEGVILLTDAAEDYTEADLAQIQRMADVFGLALARIRAQEALGIAKQAAESADQAKSRLLANLSHEVRTPLAGIIGLVDTLASDETGNAPPAEYRDTLQIIRDSADHLRVLLGNMLDFTRIEAGRICLESSPFRLRRLAQSVTGNMAVLAAQKGLALDLDVHPDVPEHLVGDATRLTQVLSNCISNAIKFTEHGRVAVRIAPAEGKAGGRQAKLSALHISVADTGIGIPLSLQDKIFDRFAQADESYARKYGGAGLGLSICRQLVRLMGGRIWVESELGAGATFHFTVVLGVVDEALLTATGEEDAAGPPHAGAQAVKAARPLRVLLAEDNAVNALVVRRFLAQLGHETAIAENGLAVLEMLRQGAYDVVLMDLEMPELDGLEAARRIRNGHAGEAARSVPIFALTAHALAQHREICLAAGMDNYLTKPLDWGEVRLALEKVGGGAPRRDSPQPPPRRSAPSEERHEVAPEEAARPERLTERLPALRRQVIWERLGGDAALHAEILAVFLEDAPTILEQLHAAAAAGKLEVMRLLAHKLKSAAAAVGAEAMRDVAVRLEHAAHEGRMTQAVELSRRLDGALAAVRRAAGPKETF